MIYYRVASQLGPSPTWQWRSTVLTSLEALFHFLRLYRAVPQDSLRVFSSSTKEDMNEQLMHENNGMGSHSVTAAQFLQERKIGARETQEGVPEPEEHRSQVREPVAISVHQPQNRSSTGGLAADMRRVSAVESRRMELEQGSGGDHDTAYTFLPPASLPQALAWIRLLAKVGRGELEP